MPPGFRCFFASSKNSLVYSAAAPLTHGSSGSEVMPSNFCFVVSRKCRPSSITTWTLGLVTTLKLCSPKYFETIVEIEPLVPKVVSKYFGEHNFNVVTNPKVHVLIDEAQHLHIAPKNK